MNAGDELHQAYQEWRRLAETEGRAIRTRNWPLLADCQKALQQLQPLILRQSHAAQYEWRASGNDPAVRQQEVCAVIEGLIQIETQNNALLQSARQSAQEQIGNLEQASRMLRQVQRFYAPSAPPAWSSFS